MESTITIRMKDVMDMRIAGARLSTVNPSSIFTAEEISPASPEKCTWTPGSKVLAPRAHADAATPASRTDNTHAQPTRQRVMDAVIDLCSPRQLMDPKAW
jgi:hypothetical protein